MCLGNLFSALAAATVQSVKAAKKRPSQSDCGESQERARDSDLKQKSAGKVPWKQLPAKALKKKSGRKSKLAFTGAI